MTSKIEPAEAGQNPDGVIEGMVFNERQVRILKFVVIGLGILLLLGFALVIITIVYQASQMADGNGELSVPAIEGARQPGAPAVAGAIAIPEGSKIISTSLDGRRLAVTLERNGTFSILVINTKTGRLVSRTELAPRSTDNK